MLQQPDRKDFEAAMYKEVKLMFDNEVWEKVPRRGRGMQMGHYTSTRQDYAVMEANNNGESTFMKLMHLWLPGPQS
eukprot:7591989-Ditylum_brightwellii.AAC.1